MVKKLLVVFVVALVIAAVGFVSIGAGDIFPVEWTLGRTEILILCGPLVGLYWLIKVYIPRQTKKRQQTEQKNQDT
jgi:hypothetical protein